MSIVKNQLARLVVASAVWLGVTSLFATIEAKTGLCEVTRFRGRDSCTAAGHLWRGFDLSGHCFLLIFCNLGEVVLSVGCGVLSNTCSDARGGEGLPWLGEDQGFHPQ